MTFTSKSEQDILTVNSCATYLGQRSFRSTVTVIVHIPTNTHTHAQPTDCLTRPLNTTTAKLVGNKVGSVNIACASNSIHRLKWRRRLYGHDTFAVLWV